MMARSRMSLSIGAWTEATASCWRLILWPGLSKGVLCLRFTLAIWAAFFSVRPLALASQRRDLIAAGWEVLAWRAVLR